MPSTDWNLFSETSAPCRIGGGVSDGQPPQRGPGRHSLRSEFTTSTLRKTIQHTCTSPQLDEWVPHHRRCPTFSVPEEPIPPPTAVASASDRKSERTRGSGTNRFRKDRYEHAPKGGSGYPLLLGPVGPLTDFREQLSGHRHAMAPGQPRTIETVKQVRS